MDRKAFVISSLVHSFVVRRRIPFRMFSWAAARRAPALQFLIGAQHELCRASAPLAVRKPKKSCRGQQNEIEGKMPGKAEILTGVTEATTSNIQASCFGDDTRDDEDGNQRVQNQ